MEIKNIKAAAEAVLFACAEPLPVERLAEVLSLTMEETEQVIRDLEGRYRGEESGLQLIHLNDAVQLCTKPVYGDFIRAILEVKRNAPLSQAALEVLAVVAYNQPVTKAFVEQIRGVDCSGVMTSLVNKGLIEEKGRLELPGRPLLYGTTPDFLRCMGVSALEELPRPVQPQEENDLEEDGGQEE